MSEGASERTASFTNALVYQRVFFLADLDFQTRALANLRKFAFVRALLESARAGDRRRRSSVTLDFDAIQIYAKPAEMQKINCSCKMSCDRIFMIKWRNILLADDLIIGRLSSGTLMQKIN